MMQWVNVLLVLITTSNAHLHIEQHQASGHHDWLTLEGLLLVGPDRESFVGKSVEYCQEKCEQDDKCTSVAVSTYNTCFLKKRTMNYRLDYRAVSYVKPPLGFQCYSNSEYWGQDLDVVATSYEDCADRCDQHPRQCDAFTWFLNEEGTHGQCLVKELGSNDKYFRSGRGAISCKKVRD